MGTKEEILVEVIFNKDFVHDRKSLYFLPWDNLVLEGFVCQMHPSESRPANKILYSFLTLKNMIIMPVAKQCKGHYINIQLPGPKELESTIRLSAKLWAKTHKDSKMKKASRVS